MLAYFDTAPDTPSDIWREPDFCRVLSFGEKQVGTDDDITDPILTTRVVQITELGYARALRDTLTFRAEPDEKGRVHSVEDYIADALAAHYAPPTHCFHDWDCCGCRTGGFTARHIGGAVFLCQSHTSRNY